MRVSSRKEPERASVKVLDLVAGCSESFLQERIPLQAEVEPKFPSTRFQGSKAKLVDWIWDCIKHLEFDSALDAFGGTGSVAYRLKREGKRVVYNDVLRFNHLVGRALIENSGVRLSNDDLEWLLIKHAHLSYPNFIEDTFHDIYYTDEENRWLDSIVTNIRHLQDPYKQAIAYFALFQACMIKRPFNLFHRKNLYLRFQEVSRGFGNKASWDRKFDHHFRKFVAEANAAVFDNGRDCLALNSEPTKVTAKYDLVYIDTPYISAKGIGVDYLHFYHFLEGLSDYDNWQHRIDYRKKHRPLETVKSEWVDKKRIHAAFERLFEHYQDSTLVVSYRDNGVPSQREMFELLRRYKNDVTELNTRSHKYVLSVYDSNELLFVAE